MSDHKYEAVNPFYLNDVAALRKQLALAQEYIIYSRQIKPNPWAQFSNSLYDVEVYVKNHDDVVVEKHHFKSTYLKAIHIPNYHEDLTPTIKLHFIGTKQQ